MKIEKLKLLHKNINNYLNIGDKKISIIYKEQLQVYDNTLNKLEEALEKNDYKRASYYCYAFFRQITDSYEDNIEEVFECLHEVTDIERKIRKELS